MFNPLKELQKPFVQRLLLLVMLALLALLLAWTILFCGSSTNSQPGLLNPYRDTFTVLTESVSFSEWFPQYLPQPYWSYPDPNGYRSADCVVERAVFLSVRRKG
jgi:hypothetical protein